MTTLTQLAHADFSRDRLIEAGIHPGSAAGLAALFAAASRTLLAGLADPAAPAHAFFVPGRIEVLGKHTDYAGGQSILAAPENGFCLVAAGRGDSAIRMTDLNSDQRADFEISHDLSPTVGHWSNYPMTTARRLARNFEPPLRGADIAFASTLPPAAGMSSSSAFMVATFLALRAVNALDARPAYRREITDAISLAQYLGCVENGQTFGSLAGDKGVGTFGGSEDHTCMLCAQAGRLVHFAYCPARFLGGYAMPAGSVFAIASSGVPAAKTGNAMHQYNLASRLARAAAEAWRDAARTDDPHLAAALSAGPAAMERMRHVLAQAGGPEITARQLLDRAEHFWAENFEIIPAAVAALAEGDLASFGRCVDRSQDLTETHLRNTVPETVFLARSARELGAAAASAFGAGFGGSVWALVQADQSPDFLARWRERYARQYPQRIDASSFFATAPGPAAVTLA